MHPTPVPDTQAAYSPAPSLWRDRAFRAVWAARTASLFGDQVTGLALPWLILLQTRSALAAGLVASVRYVPLVTLGLAAGLLADRLDRRRSRPRARAQRGGPARRAEPDAAAVAAGAGRAGARHGAGLLPDRLPRLAAGSHGRGRPQPCERRARSLRRRQRAGWLSAGRRADCRRRSRPRAGRRCSLVCPLRADPRPRPPKAPYAHRSDRRQAVRRAPLPAWPVDRGAGRRARDPRLPGAATLEGCGGAALAGCRRDRSAARHADTASSAAPR